MLLDTVGGSSGTGEFATADILDGPGLTKLVLADIVSSLVLLEVVTAAELDGLLSLLLWRQNNNLLTTK